MSAPAIPISRSMGDALRTGPSNTRPRPSEVLLIELDDDGRVPVDESARVYFKFQHFPAEITDGKSVGMRNTELPGASLPIYQWISANERKIGFSATFSCDNDLLASEGITDTLLAQHTDRNVDVRAAIAWLRRYTMPTYEQRSQPGSRGTIVGVTHPPKRLKLYIPNSGIGLAGGASLGEQGKLLVDSVVVQMTECEVTWEAYFESGLPKIATVQLGFVQLAQYNGMVRFPSAIDVGHLAKASTETRVFGYRLRPAPRPGLTPSADASNVRKQIRQQLAPGSY